MVNSTDFAKRLQKILEFYSISATAFAEEIDFNRSTISHLLSGRNKPSLEFVMKVLQKYPEVELYWLLNGKGSFPSTKKSQTKILNLPIQEKVKFERSETSEIEKEPISEISIKSSSPAEKNKKVERIVIFYSDGTFNEYKNS
ncbi:MAG: transcriptional regulator with XRE-family HTH domain [Patiriisocius sp.]|jgi:transcriptional regulator with XRE-family HTH domain